MLLTQGTEVGIVGAFLHLSSVSPLFPRVQRRKVALNLPFRRQTLELLVIVFIGSKFEGGSLDRREDLVRELLVDA